jgi:hypothetical protein
MQKTFIILTLLLVAFSLPAQINHQLTPPNLEGTIKVHPSPGVNENLVSKENSKSESRSSTSPVTVNETPTQAPEKVSVEPGPATGQETENSSTRKGSNTMLWLIIVGLVGILIGRAFRK